MTLPRHTIKVVTLGCAKNTVDSEVLMGQLKAANIRVLDEDSEIPADSVVINTCGFVNDAKEESVNTILHYVNQKSQGKLKGVYVMGCLAERYRKPLEKEIPEVDALFGVHDLRQLVEVLGAEFRGELLGERLLTTPSHYAYLKISEGCDRNCSFCAIPSIRGKHVSRTMEDILAEAANLASQGVKELILIAQDLTYYGLDIYKEQKLPDLLERLCGLNLFRWIRLHYLFPVTFPERLLDVMAAHSEICPYIDIPLQHINSQLLHSMRRGIDGKGTRQLLQKIRDRLPNAAIRTAFIVGYPGETEEMFQELKEFVLEMRFERAGVFTYSHEEGTHAFELKEDVPERIKRMRADQLMAMQQEISEQLNAEKIGSLLEIVIDRFEGGYYVGRSRFDSPEVDNEILVSSLSNLKIGEFYQAKIINSDSFDLFAEIITPLP